MDKINSLNNIVELFRSKTTNRTTGTKKKTNSSKTRKSDITKKLSTEELEHSIKHKIMQLDHSAEDFRSKANILLIENILTWEFGNSIQNDPEFIALREKINNTIKDNTTLNGDLDRLINKLLS